MKKPAIFAFLAVVLLASACQGDRRRGSSGSRGGDPSGSTPRPGGGAPICSDTCETQNDGVCDDGATGSDNDWCANGTDCTDCGTRYASSSTTDPIDGCECDIYAEECDGDCSCDPDCDRSDGLPPTSSGAFGDECVCTSADAEGWCVSSGCGDTLTCLGLFGSGFCTSPCTYVGESEECPPGSQCQEVMLEVGTYLACIPT